ncbi:uncharacterized protein ATC70_012803 [Mucor velutinosus]|uniref:Uncharacterized protein n=1 Tax=Mucor velutinosus TaxID=708070 RepID=A0AAN7D6T7_9FUNG|nr:hypothetical protein ATC70_012803 [Mucor velutinosus]
MSPTSTLSNSSYYNNNNNNNNNNTYLHPLETATGTFIERRNSCRRLSISSDLSDQEPIEPTRRANSNASHWNQLISQFDSQPDMVQLIQLCKAEEDRRRQEESKMKMKEYQVLRQLQHLQERQSLDIKKSQKELDLHLPPLSHK